MVYIYIVLLSLVQLNINNIICFSLFLSGIAALVTFFVHIWYVKRKWQNRTTQLRMLMLTGCFIQLAGVVGFAVYLALAVTRNQGKVEHDNKVEITLQTYIYTCICLTDDSYFCLFSLQSRYNRDKKRKIFSPGINNSKNSIYMPFCPKSF